MHKNIFLKLLLCLKLTCIAFFLCSFFVPHFVTPTHTNCYIFCNFEARVSVPYNLDVNNDLADEVTKKLNELDTKKFDEILSSLTNQQKAIFGKSSFSNKIKQIISGNEKFNFETFIQLIFLMIGDNILDIIPILAIVCAIAIMSNLLMKMRGKALNKSLGDIIHFACFSVIVVVVLAGVAELIKLTSSTLQSLKAQMEVLFPILLTLMASLGANTSISIYQPFIAILSGVMMNVFSKVILPIFSLSIVFNVIGNLTSTVKLNKFSDFFSNVFKISTGFCFTIFLGALSVSGIVAGSFDGISIRATKFAIKSYIPTIGGYLSDGFSLILASSVLIKNAGGYTGILLIFVTIISPLTKILLFKLGLSLVASIIEPVADQRVTNFVSKTAKSLSMLSSILIAFSFAYIVFVGLIMCTSNVV